MAEDQVPLRERLARPFVDAGHEIVGSFVVAKHEDLDVLAVLRAEAEREQLEQAPERPVEERQRHV